MADKPSFFDRFKNGVARRWAYCSSGVWDDESNSWKVRIVKTVNLTVRTFFSADMQSRACAMTYQMMLAVVPALALLVAIGRGFGLQDLLESQLYKMFPAQRTAVDYAMNFVDSYLNTSTEGVFVGVGLLFLLYTLISLFSSIEDNFNLIWDVKEGRSIGRKIVDYTAMLLILPVVMVCAGGLSIVLTSSIRAIFDWDFLTPIITHLLEGVSWFLTIIFFTLLYVLMPNTKVKFGSAFAAGIFAGVGFLILQWLFISGQIYVSKYNAIYGSFSFLPLMLLWMQFTWIIIFIGGLICYSLQNFSRYDYGDKIGAMSAGYFAKLAMAICAVVVQRFDKGLGATQASYLCREYKLPSRVVSLIADRLVKAGIFSIVEIDSKREIKGFQPAIDPCAITVRELFNRLDNQGTAGFISTFPVDFPGVENASEIIAEAQNNAASQFLVKDLKIIIPQ